MESFNLIKDFELLKKWARSVEDKDNRMFTCDEIDVEDPALRGVINAYASDISLSNVNNLAEAVVKAWSALQ